MSRYDTWISTNVRAERMEMAWEHWSEEVATLPEDAAEDGMSIEEWLETDEAEKAFDGWIYEMEA